MGTMPGRPTLNPSDIEANTAQILSKSLDPVRTTPELLHEATVFAVPLEESKQADVRALPSIPQGPIPLPIIGNIPHISRSLSLQFRRLVGFAFD